MVDEFLWELGHEQGREAAARHASLAHFGRFGSSYGVFENLRARDLVLYVAVWLPENGDLATAAEAHAAVDALRAFSAWAEESQGVPLESDVGAKWGELRDDLARLTPINARLARRRPTSGQQGRLVEYLGAGRVRDAEGNELELAPERDGFGELRAGDRLRVTPDADGAQRVVRCYLPQSAELLLELRAAR
jgi:hypothetical protein